MPSLKFPRNPCQCSDVKFCGLLQVNFLSRLRSTLLTSWLHDPKPGDDLITTLQVMCTACEEQVIHLNPEKVLICKHLTVILCRNCYKRYGDDNFQKDSSGADKYCHLVVCDSCSRSFCKSCIRRNLSYKELGCIMSLDVRNCYVRGASPIEGLVDYADMIPEFSKKQQQRLSNQLASSADSIGGKVSEEVQLKMIVEMMSQIQRALDEFSKAEEAKGAGPEDLMKMAELMHANALRLAKMTEGLYHLQRRKKQLQCTNHTRVADKKRTSSEAEVKGRGRTEEDGADCKDFLMESQSLLAELTELDFPDESGSLATPVVAELSPSHIEASASRNPTAADESAVEVGGAKTQDLCDRDMDSSASSVEGDNFRNLPTESFDSSSEGNELLTAQTNDEQRKKRSPLSKNEKALQALMRSLRYSEDGSSDEDSEYDLLLALRSRRNQKTTPTRRRAKWSPKKKAQEADADPPTPAPSGSSTPMPVEVEEPGEGPDDPKLSLVPVTVLRKLLIFFDKLTEQEKKSEDDILGLLRFPQPARKRDRMPRKPGEAKVAVAKESKKADAQGIEASDDGEVEPKKKQKAVPKEKEDVIRDCEEEEAAPEKEEDKEGSVPDGNKEDSDELGVATKNSKKLLNYDGEVEPKKKQKAVPKEKEDVIRDCEEEEAAPEKEEDKEGSVPDGNKEDSDELGVATKNGKKLLNYEKLLQKPIPGGKDDSLEMEELPENQKRSLNDRMSTALELVTEHLAAVTGGTGGQRQREPEGLDDRKSVADFVAVLGVYARASSASDA
ncbi:hypothetical protein HPB47_018534 [Ixodes persulcatus]|uniref:Uncharacterized protein n=1 Tax=Ixodes persulcatus TaxID=34615 RepID=A0AC60QKI2_IXOPE|nr:hypothetical protein HPB47_018534 [Ixodes persulcatus]